MPVEPKEQEELTTEDLKIIEDWEMSFISEDELPDRLKLHVGLPVEGNEEGLDNASSEETVQQPSDGSVENVDPASESSDQDQTDTSEEKKDLVEKVPLKKKLYDSQNKLNTANQKLKNYEKMLKTPEGIQKLLQEKGVDPSTLGVQLKTDNVWSDEHAIKLTETVNELQQKLAQAEKANQIISEEKSNDEAIFSEVSQLQNRFDSFKTETPIQDIEYTLKAIQAKEGNVTEEKLIERGISEADLNVFKRLSTLKKNQKQGENLMTAFVNSDDFSKELGGLANNRANETIAEKINESRKKELSSMPKIQGRHVSSPETDGDRGTVSSELLARAIEKEEMSSWNDLSPEEQSIIMRGRTIQ
jgi:hypothetical protein